MPDCYVVTAGEYSSISVEAVFMSEDTAQAWADEQNALQRARYPQFQYVPDKYEVQRCDFEPLLPSLVKQA